MDGDTVAVGESTHRSPWFVIFIYVINTHGRVIRLAGDPTLVMKRKYFTMIYMTVGTMTLYQATICSTCPLIQDYPVARGHAHITHAEDVSAPLDFVPGFLESSVPSTLFNYLRSALTCTHRFFVQVGRREAPHVGLQVFP